MYEKKKLLSTLISLAIVFAIIFSVIAPLSSFVTTFNFASYNIALAFKPTQPSNKTMSNQTNGWGSSGTGDGQFNGPDGIAVDPLGNIYVADTGNNRIQKFESGGKFITKWGSDGTGYEQLHTPRDISAGPLGNIYVADTLGNGVVKFNRDGTSIGGWVTFEPEAIATDISENLYVGNGNNKIVKKAINDPYFTNWGNNSDFIFANGVGLAVDDSGNVYVANSGKNHIDKLTGNGTLSAIWGKPGRGAGQFSSPSGITIDSSGSIYVADTGNNRIQKLDKNGTFITTIGSTGSADGQLLYPSGVAVDSSDNLYVADRGNNRIQVFATSSNASR